MTATSVSNGMYPCLLVPVKAGPSTTAGLVSATTAGVVPVVTTAGAGSTEICYSSRVITCLERVLMFENFS